MAVGNVNPVQTHPASRLLWEETIAQFARMSIVTYFLPRVSTVSDAQTGLLSFLTFGKKPSMMLCLSAFSCFLASL